MYYVLTYYIVYNTVYIYIHMPIRNIRMLAVIECWQGATHLIYILYYCMWLLFAYHCIHDGETWCPEVLNDHLSTQWTWLMSPS